MALITSVPALQGHSMIRYEEWWSWSRWVDALGRDLVRRRSRRQRGGRRDAVAQLRDEGRRSAAFHATMTGGDAHAGRSETSLMLHLAPGLVHRDAMVAGATRPIGEMLPALRRDGVRAVSANGVLGDPSGASPQEGAQLLAKLAEDWGRWIDALIAAGR